MSDNILSSAVSRIFAIPAAKSPESDAAWRLGNAEYEMIEALSTELSYVDALRIAHALHSYADRVRESLKKEEHK